ncbi:BolA family transcriptional regulator [Buchnera aphidicola (Brachycaudus cardui)]|uniref:BolA family transcriptional regulator n=1 Tax=Buchnera aphidicola (Brachycaudus cardui) TaxID=557993 RepID=A0A4D6XXJ7_9GAMM|nr:BolA/IbaG family iron-sulfur metabolism protein [Buchnera aphidicola]QCI20599.1 BolA family transcriptional regulator [Buchnera aphidicola (Brachycaudus cardui)]
MILKKIKKHLISKININFISIQDDSLLHKKFKEGLTHLKIIIISHDFVNKSFISRHRLIFSILSEIVKEKIYSITLDTYTPIEWNYKKNKKLNTSNCLKK